MSTGSQIKAKRMELEKQANDVREHLEALYKQCTHPNAIAWDYVSKRYHYQDCDACFDEILNHSWACFDCGLAASWVHEEFKPRWVK